MAVTEVPRPRRARFARAVIVTAVALPLAAVAFVAATNAWVAWAARGHAYTELASVPARSVAIVPGARVYNGQPFILLRARLEAALSLYRAGRVKAILVSGRETEIDPETSVMQRWLQERGVPSSAILADREGTRTRETMRRAASLYELTDAIICTQDVHIARTIFIARDAGIAAVAFSLPSRLSESIRYMAFEFAKTGLAVAESYLRDGPELPTAERPIDARLATR
jgi:vancomycin permeability regulator SanA